MNFKLKISSYRTFTAETPKARYLIYRLNTREWELKIRRSGKEPEFYKYSRYAEAKAAAILDSKTAPVRRGIISGKSCAGKPVEHLGMTKTRKRP